MGGFHLSFQKQMGVSAVREPMYTPFVGPFIKPLGGKLFKIQDQKKKIMAALVEFLDGLGVKLVTVALDGQFHDLQPFIWKEYKAVPQYTYLIDLTSETIWEDFDPKRRNDIKRAEKDGVTVEQVHDLELIISMVSKSLDRKDKGFDKKLLTHLMTKFCNEENSFSFVAKLDGRPIAAIHCLHYNGRAFYLLSGYDHNNGHSGAGALALWHGIQHAKSIGLKIFDFEGSMIPAVEKYFRSFGGEIATYFRVSKASIPLEMALKFKKREWF